MAFRVVKVAYHASDYVTLLYNIYTYTRTMTWVYVCLYNIRRPSYIEAVYPSLSINSPQAPSDTLSPGLIFM